MFAHCEFKAQEGYEEAEQVVLCRLLLPVVFRIRLLAVDIE